MYGISNFSFFGKAGMSSERFAETKIPEPVVDDDRHISSLRNNERSSGGWTLKSTSVLAGQ